MKKSKKKASKIFWFVLVSLLAVCLIGFAIFLYFHGNTKPYTVPAKVHEAIVAQKVDKGENEVRVMSSNLLVSYPSWHGSGSKKVREVSAKPRAKIYFDVLETYQPDVVGIQELCDMWYNCILRNDLGYKFVFPVSTAFNLNMTSMIYNSNTTDLLEKGQFAYTQKDNTRLRRVVWALFKDKATKKQYIVTSTHFSLIRSDKEASLKIMESQMDEFLAYSNELKEKYNVPIFHTGDYNSINNSENWTELYYDYSAESLAKLDADAVIIDQAPSIYIDIVKTLTDAKLSAEEFDAVGTTTIDSPAYDHIFLNNDVPIRRYVTISDPVMYKMSDHFSIFVDADLVAEA